MPTQTITLITRDGFPIESTRVMSTINDVRQETQAWGFEYLGVREQFPSWPPIVMRDCLAAWAIEMIRKIEKDRISA